MPLQKPEDMGTDQDGARNRDYCVYCYADGEFTSNCTMDEMIEHCLQFLDEFNKENGITYTKEEAFAEMRQFFPTLKRWAKTI